MQGVAAEENKRLKRCPQFLLPSTKRLVGTETVGNVVFLSTLRQPLGGGWSHGPQRASGANQKLPSQPHMQLVTQERIVILDDVASRTSVEVDKTKRQS